MREHIKRTENKLHKFLFALQIVRVINNNGKNRLNIFSCNSWIVFSCSLFFVLVLGMAACTSTPTVPKPRGYLRDDFPAKTYHVFDSTGFPYRFDIPAYAKITEDKKAYGYEPYFVNMQMPRYNATLHISYKRVQHNLPVLLDDTYNFVYRHVIKADDITETPFINRKRKVYGVLYELGGDVASSVQFYVTDSSRNFLRGSLYFMATPNKDSLAPSIAFLTEDIAHLMQTVEWK